MTVTGGGCGGRAGGARGAGVAGRVDFNQAVAGLPEPVRLGNTEEMPGRILHIVRVHGPVEFKLPAALGILFGVVLADPLLPEIGLNPRVLFHRLRKFLELVFVQADAGRHVVTPARLKEDLAGIDGVHQ